VALDILDISHPPEVLDSATMEVVRNR